MQPEVSLVFKLWFGFVCMLVLGSIVCDVRLSVQQLVKLAL